jgi:hypothetical protein
MPSDNIPTENITLATTPAETAYGLTNLNATSNSTALNSTDNFPGTGSDFNGDGSVDLVWRNVSNGALAIWEMNNITVQVGAGFAQMPLDWQIVAPADFNDDGEADLLWHNVNNGLVAAWIMTDGVVQTSINMALMPLDWEPLGADDFTNDGQSDILWRNVVSGEIYLWELDGTTVVNSQGIANLDPSWNLATTGDFNSDGLTDLVWQHNSNGQVYIWTRADESNFAWSGNFLTTLADWQITGSGDFNGDRKTDLLWSNLSSGVAFVVAWYMNDLQPLSSAAINTFGLSSDWLPISLSSAGPLNPAQQNPNYVFGVNGFSTTSVQTEIDFNIDILNVLGETPEPGVYADVVSNFTIDHTLNVGGPLNDGFQIKPEDTLLTVSSTALPAIDLYEGEVNGSFVSIDIEELNEGLIPLTYTISFNSAEVYPVVNLEAESAPVTTITGEYKIGFSQPASLNGETVAFLQISYPDIPENQAILALPIVDDFGNPSEFTINTFNGRQVELIFESL